MNPEQVFQIRLVIAGGLIGFLSSIGLLVLQALINKRGKLQLFVKVIHSKANGHRAPGFHQSEYQSLVLKIPLNLELQNTYNETCVIRDFCILLFNKSLRKEKMVQINYFSKKTKTSKGETVEQNVYYGNEGSYSFVVPPRSILHQECEFMLRASSEEVKAKVFDELRVRYFDEKNKEHIYHLRKIEHCWEPHSFEVDKEWALLSKK